VSAAAEEVGPVYLRSYLAPLAQMLARPDVTDIYVNRPGELWVETSGGLVERHKEPKLDEAKRDFLHHRVCEQAFNATGGGKASTVYDAIGAAQVAKASFAGMRLLHRLDGRVSMWPFDEAAAGRSLVVEIYTRAFIRLAGLSGRKVRTLTQLDVALTALGSRPSILDRDPNDHESDVLIAAAGLRAIAGETRYWNPPDLTPALARSEGWTFGVV
jgi:hypothetical protein